MTSRLLLTKKDPRRTDFVFVGGSIASPCAHPASAPVYTSDTTPYPLNGRRATTTVVRTDPTGDRFQVGVIEWPSYPHDHVQLVIGTRHVSMSRSGIFTSPERFTAIDGGVYEWQIRDARPQLVPIRSHTRASYVATFLQSHSGFWFRRKHTSSLFIPPEGMNILDDIVVTFIYFESKWRDKEGVRSRSSMSSPV